jgi:hypothetical protein
MYTIREIVSFISISILFYPNDANSLNVIIFMILTICFLTNCIIICTYSCMFWFFKSNKVISSICLILS